MKCSNLEDYTRIYMINDVLLLADVFENFRNLSLRVYELDPCWYFTSPGLAWDAMLKKTKVELEVLQDVEKYLMIEKGIRGGIVNAVKRYSKFVVQSLIDVLNGEREDMCLKIDDYIDYLNNLGRGCIFEVDLEYPKELHSMHNDFPLCPENVKIDKVKKLCNTLFNKEKYVIHYTNLLQCIQLGLKVKKIHRILTFKESDWLKEYIEMNTNLRKTAKNDFEKDFFKLMNNSVFGKTMENVRERVDVRLVTDENKIVKLASKPNYKRTIMYNKELSAVEMEKINITLDKPIYVGFAILDLSKWLMYDFHYNVMQKKYGDNINLCYQDTDSLIYEIFTPDLYEDIQKDSILKNEFDFSDYPPCHHLYSTENKKVVGKFKDELNGLVMEELIALRPKQYGYKIAEETRENFREYYNKKSQEEKKNPKLPKVPKPGDEKEVSNNNHSDDFRSLEFEMLNSIFLCYLLHFSNILEVLKVDLIRTNQTIRVKSIDTNDDIIQVTFCKEIDDSDIEFVDLTHFDGFKTSLALTQGQIPIRIKQFGDKIWYYKNDPSGGIISSSLALHPMANNVANFKNFEEFDLNFLDDKVIFHEHILLDTKTNIEEELINEMREKADTSIQLHSNSQDGRSIWMVLSPKTFFKSEGSGNLRFFDSRKNRNPRNRNSIFVRTKNHEDVELQDFRNEHRRSLVVD
ncbi:Protein CBG05187 [Caenorhabditis briggsae]|uniref:Protein CBG05187 n=1 Tax=Caenorhabditis briggsae TaxID=6238 RepID=A8WZC1_CAEBR|nr:Protein CBG05187 [Caenorhabditis briggsae]CAP25731.1 Protein CBG05187 [Caenorhabditis briggsae]